MKNIEIKNRFSGKVIICGNYKSIKDCLEKNKTANLSGANLSGANLYGEKPTKNPLQILGLKYWVLILERQIKIGCEIHKAEEWEKFDDERIKKMDKGALEWWKIYKPIILGLWKEQVK